MDGDFGVFSNGGPFPGVPLEFQDENGLLLRCVGNIWIPLQTSRGMDSHLERRCGKPGSS